MVLQNYQLQDKSGPKPRPALRQVRPPIDWTSLASRRLDKSGPEISPGQVQPRDKSGLKVFGTSPASKFLDMSGLETSPAPKIALATSFETRRPKSVVSGNLSKMPMFEQVNDQLLVNSK